MAIRPEARARQAAQSATGWNIAAAALGLFLATLIEGFVIARFEPPDSVTAAKAVPLAIVDAGTDAANEHSFDIRQRVLPDELPPTFGTIAP